MNKINVIQLCALLKRIGINPENCYLDKDDNLIIPESEIKSQCLIDRKMEKILKSAAYAVDSQIIKILTESCSCKNGIVYEGSNSHTCWECLKAGRLG